jgi:hypothetical protein
MRVLGTDQPDQLRSLNRHFTPRLALTHTLLLDYDLKRREYVGVSHCTSDGSDVPALTGSHVLVTEEEVEDIEVVQGVSFATLYLLEKESGDLGFVLLEFGQDAPDELAITILLHLYIV